LDSERSLENWNKWVTKCRGEYSVRVKSAHLTRESGSSSWPTIRASEYKDTGPIGSKSHDHMPGKGYLCAVVTQDAANWPTASMSMTAGYSERDNCNSSKKAGHVGNELLRQVIKHGLPAPANPSTDGSRQGLWATPSGYMNTNAAEENRNSLNLGMQTKQWATPQAKDHKSGHRDATIVQYKQLNVEVEARATGKLNPRWVETLMGLPVGWVMPSCQYPITPQGDASQEFQLSTTGNWPTASTMDVITPTRDLTQMESKGHWGKQPRQRPDGIGFIAANTGKLSEMVHYTSPVTIVPTNSDYSATELSQQQQNEHSELF
jgi:hypothetical protein